jgi:hypothetical protein
MPKAAVIVALVAALQSLVGCSRAVPPPRPSADTKLGATTMRGFWKWTVPEQAQFVAGSLEALSQLGMACPRGVNENLAKEVQRQLRAMQNVAKPDPDNLVSPALSLLLANEGCRIQAQQRNSPLFWRGSS